MGETVGEIPKAHSFKLADCVLDLANATSRAVEETGLNLPEDDRAELAIYCYQQETWQETGLRLAAFCGRESLVRSGGDLGERLFAETETIDFLAPEVVPDPGADILPAQPPQGTAEDEPYFKHFENRVPPQYEKLSPVRRLIWHLFAGATIGTSLWYLHWRWTESLNPDALVFSSVVAGAETLFFLGTLLFFFDIWDEGDTERKPAPETREDANLDGANGPITVDIYITTYDETPDVVTPSIVAAQNVTLPENTRAQIHILDDGNRLSFARLCREMGVNYITRNDNEGFKAGNLRNALFQTNGDFVAICDADTRLEPTFLVNTLGYFKDPKVAWVQTPHWFYDIPEGQAWEDWLQGKGGRALRVLAPVMRILSGQSRVGDDPFLSDTSVFFDVIQRRRNRHGASFCCGAGSIHRREAVFDGALKRKGDEYGKLSRKLKRTEDHGLLASVPLQPYRYHVSEDIYTSILLQEDREHNWISVYHPQVEARMLSPWTIGAWATQKLKYAGGTYDIMMRDNPVFRKGLPWQTKLHYGATFWSYLTALWTPVLLLAPVFSLYTGLAPVEAYSLEFFLRFLPVIFLSEIAVLAATKGYDPQPGRQLSLTTLPIQLRAFWMVLRGKRPKFPPTPKTPVFGEGRHYITPNLWLLAIMMSAGVYGLVQHFLGSPDHSQSLLIVNFFWLGWNMFAVARIVSAAFWTPHAGLSPSREKDA